MASDLKSDLVSKSYDMGPHVKLMGNPAVRFSWFLIKLDVDVVVFQNEAESPPLSLSFSLSLSL